MSSILSYKSLIIADSMKAKELVQTLDQKINQLSEINKKNAKLTKS